MLVEQIIKEIDKDYRFKRASRLLSDSLTDSQKSELNKNMIRLLKNS